MIRGKTLVLRPLEESDAEKLRSWRMHDGTRRAYLGYRFPIVAEAEREWVLRVADPSNRDLVYLGATHEPDGLVGLVNLRDISWIDRTAKLGVLIGPEFQGRGFGREAVELVLQYGFGDLNLHRVELEVRGDNDRAIALYRALGFREEGRLRERWFDNDRYHDIIVMGLLRQEGM